MKKIISVLLVFATLLSLLITVPVSAAVTPIDSESFDPGYSTERYFAKQVTGFDGMATMTAMVDENDATIGNYIRAAWGFDTAKYPTYNYNVKNSFELAADDKMELEFDVRLTGYDSTAFQIRLKGTPQTYVVNFETSGKIYRQATNTSEYKKQIGTMPTGWAHTNFKNWTRLKFVFAHTKYMEQTGETTEYEGKKLTALYVNGQPITLAENASSNVAYDNGTIWGAMDGNNAFTQTNEVGYKGFYFGNKMAQTNMIDVDNINVITYTTSDTAPIDKGTLVSEIRRVKRSYDTQYAESGSDTTQAEYFAEFKSSIDEATTLYQDAEATKEQIDTAIVKMDAFTLVATEPVWIWNDDINTDTTGNYLKVEGSPTVEHDTTKFASDVTQEGVMKISKNTSNYPRMAVQFEGADKRISVDSGASSAHGKNAFAEFEYDLNISELLTTDKKYISFVTYLIDTTSKGLRPFSLEIQPSGTISYGHHDSAPNEINVGPTGVFDHTRTNRIKLVLQLTDATGNATQLVDGIYLNGTKLNEEPIAFTNINPGGDTEANYINRLGFYVNSMKNTTGSYYIDNVKICTYNKKRATDPSQVEDTTELTEMIRQKYAELNMVQDNSGRYPQEVQNQLTSCIQALEDYYTSRTGDKDTLYREAEAVTAALKAANMVTVYDADPGSTVSGDGTYGITSTISEIGTSAKASFDAITLDASFGESAYVLTEFEVKTEDFLNNDTQLTVDLKDADTAFATVTLNGGEHPNITLNDINSKQEPIDIWYGTVTDGEWMTIRLRTQITDADNNVINENTAFYINGNDVMLRTAEDPGKSFKTPATKYDGLSFSATGNGKAYVDNVRVVKYYGETNEPTNFAQLIASIRKGDTKLAKATAGTNVTEEIKNAYQTAQTTAKEVAEASPVPLQDTVDKANDTLCQAYAKFLFADEATEIGTISFEDASGNPAAFVTAGGSVTGVSVIKKAEYNYDGVVLVTVHDANGMLIGLSVEEDVLKGSEIGTIPVALTNPITLPGEVEGITVKAHIWSNADAMMPIADAHVAEQAEATIYVAGDSIVQTYNQEYMYPRDGWGAYVDDYYTSNISQNNLAISGYTLRSYIEKGKMQIVEENMKDGDYFFVSFMANDSSAGSPKHVKLLDYKNLLRHYGEVAKKHGAQVVYVTSPPVLNEVVDSDNCYGNGSYPAAMREVAKELGAPLIDVYAMRKQLQREKGYAYVESAMYMCNETALHNNFGADALARDFIKGYYDGEGNFDTSDKTHISVWGAKWCASKIAEAMQDTNCGLRYSVNKGSFYSFPTVWTASAQ